MTMKPGDVIHLGDGAYLRIESWAVAFLANSHEHPTDQVWVDKRDVPNLIHLLQVSIEESNDE